MKDEAIPTRKRHPILLVTAVILSLALAAAGYAFLYYPPLDWPEHLEVFEDSWGIADPSYRNWSGKIKNIGPHPIRSAALIVELKDASGNVSYTGSKQLVDLSDPPIYPQNVKRFGLLLKYTKAEHIDDTQTTYRVEIHKYEKKWFWK